MGRGAVVNVVTARVSPSLFAEGQMERLVIASSGNLRDLFFMISDAAERAQLRSPNAKTIESADALKNPNGLSRCTIARPT